MRREPKPYEIFTHFKGNKYQVLAIATHSETGEKYIVYQAMYGDFQNYVRPYDMFMSEVDHEKYPEVNCRYRFYREDEAEEWVPQSEKQPVKETELCGGNEEKDPAENAPDAYKEQESVDASEWNIDPLVLDFLDADTYDARMNILAELHPRVTDDMINTMAVAIDVEIDEGPIEKRYEELKHCMLTRERYERSR